MGNSRSQLLKGVLDACVMAVIKEEPVYGYELSRKLKSVGLPSISEGTIYPILLRLQKKQWITSELRPSPSGPDRKYYDLTERGRDELENLSEEWCLIAAPVSKLLRREE
ncbi:PadR family transcriptional regulator [Bacillus sp. 1P06AnD]|uniref:PadR family transcriptional regulator n=1 Tax=Bacillus sp. 1P06AnD TaxID=3132208 RepID=UPI0039A3A6BE